MKLYQGREKNRKTISLLPTVIPLYKHYFFECLRRHSLFFSPTHWIYTVRKKERSEKCFWKHDCLCCLLFALLDILADFPKMQHLQSYFIFQFNDNTGFLFCSILFHYGLPKEQALQFLHQRKKKHTAKVNQRPSCMFG